VAEVNAWINDEPAWRFLRDARVYVAALDVLTWDVG
jgi:hypothetical protein